MSGTEGRKINWIIITGSAVVLALELYRMVLNPDFLIPSLGNWDPLIAAIATELLVINVVELCQPGSR